LHAVAGQQLAQVRQVTQLLTQQRLQHTMKCLIFKACNVVQTVCVVSCFAGCFADMRKAAGHMTTLKHPGI
jgi:hypothetical protein